MISPRTTIITLAALLCATSVYAQKPKWVGNTPDELNKTYKFIEIVSYGNTIGDAQKIAIENLAKNTLLENSVKIYQKTQTETYKDKIRVNSGALQEVKHEHITVNTVIDGVPMNLTASPIDEYAVKESGRFKLHTLFQVATCDNPVFDNVYTTTKYGVNGLWRSAICPGWGQIYKGSTFKGVTILAAEAIAAAGIIFTENERASYESKMRSQPNFAKKYKSKVDNYETARNCCIGAAAAIYIYNLIDAIAAPGARRIKVKPRNTQISPSIYGSYTGISVNYNF